jgi:hypothetical protein
MTDPLISVSPVGTSNAVSPLAPLQDSYSLYSAQETLSLDDPTGGAYDLNAIGEMDADQFALLLDEVIQVKDSFIKSFGTSLITTSQRGEAMMKETISEMDQE